MGIFNKNNDIKIKELQSEIYKLNFKIDELTKTNLSLKEHLEQQAPLIKEMQNRLYEQSKFIDKVNLIVSDNIELKEAIYGKKSKGKGKK